MMNWSLMLVLGSTQCQLCGRVVLSPCATLSLCFPSNAAEKMLLGWVGAQWDMQGRPCLWDRPLAFLGTVTVHPFPSHLRGCWVLCWGCWHMLVSPQVMNAGVPVSCRSL